MVHPNFHSLHTIKTPKKKNRKLFGQLQYQMKFALLLQTLSEYPRCEVVKICYFLINIEAGRSCNYTQNNKPFSVVEFQ